MYKKIEGLAWLVLLASFFTCILLAVAIPSGIRWYILNATRPLSITLEVRQGTVTRQRPGSSTREQLGEMNTIHTGERLDLSSDADALLLFYRADQPNAPVVTIQLYGRTTIVPRRARTPRFPISKLPHRVSLEVLYGTNIHLSVEEDGRPSRLLVTTPQGKVTLDEGLYTIAVDGVRTELSVRSGQAHIPDPATGESFILTSLQRTELTEDGIGTIDVGERNLLHTHNGDFSQPLEGTWKTYNIVGVAGESPGTVRRVAVGDHYIVLLSRAGLAHAETGIIQELNQDIRGAQTLRVRARIRVDTQTLDVCGSLGTECPVMIRLTFKDQRGTPGREWLQGFYAVEGTDKPFCQSCEWQARHIKVPQGIWYDYESPDLLPLLREQNIVPVMIQSVKIYASGHTYSAAVDEIAILVGE